LDILPDLSVPNGSVYDAGVPEDGALGSEGEGPSADPTLVPWWERGTIESGDFTRRFRALQNRHTSVRIRSAPLIRPSICPKAER
jgi:hypothetical protein